MKTLMLRGLDEKPDVVEILRRYMNRLNVNTIAASTALESLVRQFDKDEKRNLDYRLRTKDDLKRGAAHIRTKCSIKSYHHYRVAAVKLVLFGALLANEEANPHRGRSTWARRA